MSNTLPDLSDAERRASISGRLSGGGDCMCGCGEIVEGWFARGHYAVYRGKLMKVERLGFEPKHLFPAWMVTAMGPWTKVEGGQVPSKRYDQLASVRAKRGDR